MLAACAGRDPSMMATTYSKANPPSEEKAIVIAGSAMEYMGGGWLTGRELRRNLNVETLWVNIEKARQGKSAGPTRFEMDWARPTVYVVDPGTYVMLRFRSAPWENTIRTGDGIYLDPQAGSMMVPTFTVEAGEVVHLGSQVFRFTVPGKRYEVLDDRAALEEHVISEPRFEAIRDRIETRLIRIMPLSPNTPGVGT